MKRNPLRQHPRLIGTVAVVVAVLIGVGGWLLVRRDSPRLDGAELIGGAGDVRIELAEGDKTSDQHLRDVDMRSASLVASGGQNDLLLLDEPRILVRATRTGQINKAGVAVVGSGEDALAIAEDGHVAKSADSTVLVWTFSWLESEEIESRFDVGAIAFGNHDTLILGSDDDPRIDIRTADGNFRRIVGPPGDEHAEAELDKSVGPISSIVAMPDGRVAFVTGMYSDPRLHIWDDGEVQTIQLNRGFIFRKDSTSTHHPYYRDTRYPMQPIAPAPDGDLLVTGEETTGTPVIGLLDIDSGSVKRLAELKGIEPSVERPTSAAAVGDDLVFLADGRLWRKPRVFD